MYALVCVCACLRACVCVCVKPKFMWNHNGIEDQMIQVICCFSFEYCQPLGVRAFRRAFTTNVAPQCRAFEIEKLKAPLSRGPEGAGGYK